VRSPASLKVLPLNATSTGVTFDAGRFAALTRNLLLSKVFESMPSAAGKAMLNFKEVTSGATTQQLALEVCNLS
jgi:hypothetical protein